jgi:DNA polymerase
MVDLSSFTTLESLHAAIRAFEGCTLKAHAQNTVIGDGHPTSGIVLIGEAPGAQEDAQGKPFVGRSGQLLDKLLAEIGLDRTKVYITNTVFWRPPDNRTPTALEVAACRPFLDRHLSLLNPKLLLLVGGTAAKTVLNTTAPLSTLRHRWHPMSNPYLPNPIPALAVFHPAYLLRNPSASRDMREDLQMFEKHVKNMTQKGD